MCSRQLSWLPFTGPAQHPHYLSISRALCRTCRGCGPTASCWQASDCGHTSRRQHHPISCPQDAWSSMINCCIALASAMSRAAQASDGINHLCIQAVGSEALSCRKEVIVSNGCHGTTVLPSARLVLVMVKPPLHSSSSDSCCTRARSCGSGALTVVVQPMKAKDCRAVRPAPSSDSIGQHRAGHDDYDGTQVRHRS